MNGGGAQCACAVLPEHAIGCWKQVCAQSHLNPRGEGGTELFGASEDNRLVATGYRRRVAEIPGDGKVELARNTGQCAGTVSSCQKVSVKVKRDGIQQREAGKYSIRRGLWTIRVEKDRPTIEKNFPFLWDVRRSKRKE